MTVNVQTAPVPSRPGSRDGKVSLEGMVSLITGSTGGIGLGIARALAAAGSAVVINGFGRPEDIAEARLRIMADFHVETRYSPADMSSVGAIAGMIAMALDAFGRIDVLVNNAGLQHVASLPAFPPEKWDAILAINLSSVFHTTRLVLPAMRQNGFGRIINIASAHGLVASPFQAACVAAEHGILGLTKVTALEVAQDGITCNAICAGHVGIASIEGEIEAEARARGGPNRKFVMAGELGTLAVFLAGEGAASITGAALPVDGDRAAH